MSSSPIDGDGQPRGDEDADVAVLVSGGIDSAILCVDLLREFARVHPLYVRFGLRWEDVELSCLRRFLAEAGRGRPGLMPLQVLDEPVADVYGDRHWSTGAPTSPTRAPRTRRSTSRAATSCSPRRRRSGAVS